MLKGINSSLWLLTCWTDNVILYQSDHSPGKLQWLRVVTHRCRQIRIPSKQHSSLCTVATVTSLPEQWRNDCDYDSKSPTKQTISIYCKRECCALSLGMEAFKKREEHYCGGKLRKQPCYISAKVAAGERRRKWKPAHPTYSSLCSGRIVTGSIFIDNKTKRTFHRAILFFNKLI